MSKSKFTMLDSLSLQDFDENSELIPLMTTEDEEAIKNESLPETISILSLRNTVYFLESSSLLRPVAISPFN